MAWQQLADIYRECAQYRRDEQQRVPLSCPNDGEPLTVGPDGTRFCKADGWTYPRDWTRPA